MLRGTLAVVRLRVRVLRRRYRAGELPDIDIALSDFVDPLLVSCGGVWLVDCLTIWCAHRVGVVRSRPALLGVVDRGAVRWRCRRLARGRGRGGGRGRGDDGRLQGRS
jgi:hypothetical protein